MYRWCNPNQQRLLVTSSSALILSCVVHAEVHAALAAALYADKHATVPAEQQFTIATLLDSRYTNPSWVKSTKHWPPSLIASLQKFIALRWSPYLRAHRQAGSFTDTCLEFAHFAESKFDISQHSMMRSSKSLRMADWLVGWWYKAIYDSATSPFLYVVNLDWIYASNRLGPPVLHDITRGWWSKRYSTFWNCMVQRAKHASFAKLRQRGLCQTRFLCTLIYIGLVGDWGMERDCECWQI